MLSAVVFFAAYVWDPSTITDNKALQKQLPAAQKACAAGEDAVCSDVVDHVAEWIGWVRPGVDPLLQRSRPKATITAVHAFFQTSCARPERRGCVQLGDMHASPFWGLP